MERRYTAWGIMRALLIAQLMLVLFGVVAAFAGPNDTRWPPPDRYSGTYSGYLDLRYLQQHQVFTECGRLFAAYGFPIKSFPNQKGCALQTGIRSWIVVVIDSPYLGSTPEDVLEHEIGHVMGWPSHHPD